MPLLFVYGTLKTGQRNHALLRGQRFLGPVRTAPRYRLVDCGRYPGLVEEEQQPRAVAGELWEVDESALARLDDFEGVPTLYERRLVALEGAGGPAFSYFYLGEAAGLPDCGECWAAP